MKNNSKLVRDKIPEIIQTSGGKAVLHVADELEYWQKLKEKLSEEVEEFKQAENLEELADVLEVIKAIIEYKKFDPKTLEEMKQKKANERGQFKNRIILDES